MIKPRTLARRLALQYCFVCDVNETWNLADWDEFLIASTDENDDGLVASVAGFSRELVSRVIDNREEIDARISRSMHNWEISRLAAVERNVLRLAVAEMSEGKLDKNIIFSEAVSIAKSFGSKDSGKFVNGVLDALAKDL